MNDSRHSRSPSSLHSTAAKLPSGSLALAVNSCDSPTSRVTDDLGDVRLISGGFPLTVTDALDMGCPLPPPPVCSCNVSAPMAFSRHRPQTISFLPSGSLELPAAILDDVNVAPLPRETRLVDDFVL